MSCKLTDDLSRRDLALAIGAGGLAIASATSALAQGASKSADDLKAIGPDFYNGKLRWYAVEGFDHIAYHILEADEQLRTVDVLFKFAANQKIALHRHKAAYRTLVLQGELRIYRANGELKETRPTGSYVAKPAGGEPHTEGGGDIDAIVYFSNRGVDGVIYELLDDKLNIVSTFGFEDFKKLLAGQEPT